MTTGTDCDADTFYEIGNMYREGDGVRRDALHAIIHFKKAAELGHVGAEFALGQMYRAGEGVATDVDAAVNHYLAAATQGHAEAQMLLGSLFDLGAGVPKNSVIAHVFYSMAAAQGRAGSLDRLKKVESRMTPVLRDQAHSLRKILS